MFKTIPLMGDTMIRKILIGCIALFLLTGAVAAVENANGTDIEKHEEITKFPDIKLNHVTGKEGKKIRISSKLTDENGKAIKNAKVTYKIGTRKYTARTDSKGKSSIVYKLPKAKHFKTIKTKKGNILTKKEIFKTVRTVKVSYNGSDTGLSAVKSAKVISKKSPAVKKYKFEKVRKTEIIPCRFGDHEYRRGPVIIQTIWSKDHGFDDLWIAADTKNHKIRLSISAKLHTRDGNGNWKWDEKWRHMMSEHDLIVSYYGKLPKTDMIKVRYGLVKYTPVK